MDEIKLGRFLHVSICQNCEWFKKPAIFTKYGFLPNVFSCCPDCGSEEIKVTAGRYQYIEIIEKHIFSKDSIRKEIVGFKKRIIPTSEDENQATEETLP